MVEPSWQAVVTPGTVAGGGCEDVASSVVVVLGVEQFAGLATDAGQRVGAAACAGCAVGG
jgi:hypothetical protein